MVDTRRKVKNSMCKIHFIKAMSRDSFLIELDDKSCILIDCGYKFTYESELKPVLQRLHKEGYRLNLLVITHMDEDHIGGAMTKLRKPKSLYLQLGKMKQNMYKVDEHLRTRMRIVIWNQWKSREKRIWGLRKLGAHEWMAKQSAGFAEHYQALAKTTGLRFITKEIFKRRGLITCLDYYLN